MTKAKNVLFCD